ncbi:MAG: hypothetical protein FJ405_09270 [Verrucomicrobia bacterium]|nr:hypothetical protein [Verrucomicrobiota bacterium]
MEVHLRSPRPKGVGLVLSSVILCILLSLNGLSQDSKPDTAAPSQSDEGLKTDLGLSLKPAVPKILEPGLLDGKLKLRSRSPETPDGPLPSPGVSRRDFLRLKDQAEEKKNWAFVEPGQFKEEREQKESDPMRDRWEVQDDLRPRSWWEMDPGSSSGSSPSSQSKFENDLRTRQLLRLRSPDANRPGTGPSLNPGLSRDSSKVAGAHQNSSLSMRDLVGAPEEASRFEKYDHSRQFGLNEIFHVEPMSRREKEEWNTRRLEFRDFLNQSRVGGSPLLDNGPTRSAGAPVLEGGMFSPGRGASMRDRDPGVALRSGSERPSARETFDPPSIAAPRPPGSFYDLRPSRPETPVSRMDLLAPPKRRF